VPQNCFETVVAEECDRLRLDVFLADAIEDASRAFIQKVVKARRVRVNGKVCARPARLVTSGDAVAVDLPPPRDTRILPENIPIDILHEDDDVIVVNKPSGMVVHPAPGHRSGTLVNAVLFHCPDFRRPGDDPLRPGIVHRLDRYTSGVMVVAKTESAFSSLSAQAREHRFGRRYLALVAGEFKEDRGTIDAPVGRSIADRTRMTVTGLAGRDAVTHYEVLERFGIASLVALELDTGRTHQVRVHLRFAGRRVLGDPVYGVVDYAKWRVPRSVRAALSDLEGQALHAERLGFEHPGTGKWMTFSAPPPGDFQAALEALRALKAV